MEKQILMMTFENSSKGQFTEDISSHKAASPEIIHDTGAPHQKRSGTKIESAIRTTDNNKTMSRKLLVGTGGGGTDGSGGSGGSDNAADSGSENENVGSGVPAAAIATGVAVTGAAVLAGGGS
jgi:hypothetical protein